MKSSTTFFSIANEKCGIEAAVRSDREGDEAVGEKVFAGASVNMKRMLMAFRIFKTLSSQVDLLDIFESWGEMAWVAFAGCSDFRGAEFFGTLPFPVDVFRLAAEVICGARLSLLV